MINWEAFDYEQVLSDVIHKSQIDIDKSSPRPHILLVMPSTSSCRAIARMLAATACIQQKKCCLAKMITCINVDTWVGFRWNGLQNLVGQVDPLFTSHVLLLGRRSKQV